MVSIFVEAAACGEDYESNLSVTKHRQFVGLLQQSIAALAEGDLSIRGVLDPLNLDFASSHFFLLGIRAFRFLIRKLHR